MIIEDAGYQLPNVTYVPGERELWVKFEGTEYEWFAMPIKLGSRQAAQIREYLEDMEKLGKVVDK